MDLFNELYDKLFPSLWKKSYMKLKWEPLLESNLKRKITIEERKTLNELLSRIAIKGKI